MFYLSISNGYAKSSASEQARFDLLLAGGGLKTCSSMASTNCKKNPFNDVHLTQLNYQINDVSVQKFLQSQPVITLPEQQRLNIDSIIRNINAELAGQVVSRSALSDGFDAIGQMAWFQALPDELYYALLDSFEVSQQDVTGARKREQASLAQTQNEASVNIYRTFVAQSSLRKQSQQAKPIIAVVTASSRDPFEVADFYISVFEQAGAEVIWLPIDKTYQQARELENAGFKGCDNIETIRARNLSFYRHLIYPERVSQQVHYCKEPDDMLSELEKVQGVFFNGGDQSLTLAALKFSNGVDSPELALIKRRVADGDLIVGGTSAGTAVQAGGEFENKPVPMITNGDSANAMQRGAFSAPPPSQRCMPASGCGAGIKSGDLTFKATGGTGLFSLGLVDTHFSERDRETRLAVFTAQTQQRFGFGVDEATALLSQFNQNENKWILEIIGEGGVFIVDRDVSSERNFVGIDNHKRRQREVSALSHYLTEGDKASFNLTSGTWQFDFKGQPINRLKRLEEKKRGQWRASIYQHCGSKKTLSWQQFENNYVMRASQATQFSYQNDKKACSYARLPFVINWQN